MMQALINRRLAGATDGRWPETSSLAGKSSKNAGFRNERQRDQAGTGRLLIQALKATTAPATIISIAFARLPPGWRDSQTPPTTSASAATSASPETAFTPAPW